MVSNELQNKRQSQRGFVQLPVTYITKDCQSGKTATRHVMSRDISTGGIYFETDEVLLLGQELEISFQLPGSANLTQAVIRIVRVETLPKSKLFGAGSIFLNLNSIDEARIQALVEQRDINRFLKLAIQNQASDLHFLANTQPILRVSGELKPLDMPVMSGEELRHLIYNILNRGQIEAFEKDKELDFGIQYDAGNRFRANVHQQKGYLEATFRLIHSKGLSFEGLNISEAAQDLARQKNGLVIISGPTGSGKTTTMAAMVNLINQERKAVIITLERPIEYAHKSVKSIIKQREVGVDTNSFSAALKSSLRQDPNVIVVGELDDVETVKTAIIAAEAGYLVIASFHAPNATQTIDRMASMFSIESRKQILSQLANCLKGIITQYLVPKTDRKGRILVSEVLIVNDAIRRFLRHDELFQIPNTIQSGGAYKMQSFDSSLKACLDKGLIEPDIFDVYSQESLSRPA